MGRKRRSDGKRLACRAAAFGVAALLFALAPGSAFAFSASFEWCFGSPGFTLKDVPAGTASIEFVMTDLDKPDFRHGGGRLPYTGPSIPCGAFSLDFIGPAPPEGQVHTYEFTLKAFGAKDEVLATTKAQRKFPE